MRGINAGKALALLDLARVAYFGPGVFCLFLLGGVLGMRAGSRLSVRRRGSDLSHAGVCFFRF